MPMIILIIAVMLGGGVTLASEQSLPGDTLYPMKVHFNEAVRGSFALSAEGKAAADIRRVDRRLEEAEKLALEGKLKTDAAAQVESNFDLFAERAQERIAQLKTEEKVDAAAELSSNFEASLKAHERILAKLAADGTSDTKADVTALATKVHAFAKGLATQRAEIEQRFSARAEAETKVAAEGKLNAAENVIAEVKSFIEREKEQLGAEATVTAEAQVKVAEEAVGEGKAKLEAQAYGEAFAAFQKALRLGQEAKILIKAWKNLNIDVRPLPSIEWKTDMKGEAGAEAKMEMKEGVRTTAESAGSSKARAEGEATANVQATTDTQAEASGAGTSANTNASTNTEGGLKLKLDF